MSLQWRRPSAIGTAVADNSCAAACGRKHGAELIIGTSTSLKASALPIKRWKSRNVVADPRVL